MRRIEVALRPGLFDAQGHVDALRVRDSLGLRVRVEYRKVFTADLGLSEGELERFAREVPPLFGGAR